MSSCLCLQKLILGLPLPRISHMCLPAAQAMLGYTGVMMYLLASYYMVVWYYNAQQARGLSNEVLACFAMSAVLASAGFMVADLAPRLWLIHMLLETEASQAVSFSFCLTWCTASLHVRNVSLLESTGMVCIGASSPKTGLAGPHDSSSSLCQLGNSGDCMAGLAEHSCQGRHQVPAA